MALMLKNRKFLLHCPTQHSNLSRNAVARQIARELHRVTWVVSHYFCCAKHCTKLELSSTFRNRLYQLATPLHSVSPLQQLASQFYGRFNNCACAQFLFFVLRSTARQDAEKIAHCNRASTPNLGNLQRYNFNHCEISC